MITETSILRNDYAFLQNNLSPQNYVYFFSQSQSQMEAHDYISLLTLFEAIEKAKKEGLYCVGYFAYEAGLIMRGIRRSSEHPCAHFTFYQHCHQIIEDNVEWLEKLIRKNQEETQLPNIIYDVNFDTSYDQYRKKFDQIQAYLNDGYSYEVNYTGQYHFRFQGNYFELYRLLKKQQMVSYSAFLPLTSGHILSFSPELFFTKKENMIKVKPMKGTVPRTLNQQLNTRHVEFLKNDEKNLSENLIIVDLLRNDLASIAKTGTVKAESLFDIETYESVYQMTSTITAEVDERTSLENLIDALFPCGSITGAPKLSTMNIINDVEQQDRGLYTGAIGYIMPNNDMCFSVAIRTLQFNQNGNGYLGVGGGITTRSDLDEEWAEWHLKGRFFTQLSKDFQLIETLLYKQGYHFLEAHLRRMANSAVVLGFIFDKDQSRQQLLDLIKYLDRSEVYKVRVLLDQKGTIYTDYQTIKRTSDHRSIICCLSEDRVVKENILFQHKTNAISTRGFYDSQLSYHQFRDNDIDDVIFVNQQNCVTETTRYNLVFKINDQLFTPPVDDGLLNGIYRQYLLDTSTVEEQSMSLDKLDDVDELYVCNSVRGMCPVKLVNNSRDMYEDGCLY